MNSVRHCGGWVSPVLILFCVCLVPTAHTAALGQGTQAAPPEPGGNPFAGFFSESEPQPQSMPAPVVPPEVRLETIVLKFLDATSLKGVLDKMVSSYGTVAVNTKTNSVIICDTPENLARILSEIRKADQTPLQVMVEVVILDVQLKNDAEIGVNWDFLSEDPKDTTYRQSMTSQRVAQVRPLSETLGAATAYNSVGLGGDFSVVTGSVRNVLHMIQQKRDAEILASPRALVVSGQTATIKAVEEIPFEEVIDTATGGAQALTSTRFKEVGVTLRVEATVTDGNNIFLTIQASQNVAIGESIKAVPVVDTREANTSLLLQDGQTVVVGGLRREEKTKQTSQIPILGDLPLIGLLFRSVNTVTSHSELVVLLSPRIYRGGAVPAEITARVDAMQSHSPLKTQAVTESNESESHKAQE
jgi:type II secretory pathway component GspD/PulD (secretin)